MEFKKLPKWLQEMWDINPTIARRAEVYLQEASKASAQQTRGKICLCDDCIVEQCDMRGEAVECSGRTGNGKLRNA